MEVSKLTLGEKLSHQESNITKILKWMQDNPRQCVNTSIPTMSHWMTGVNLTENTKRQILTKMVREDIVHRVGTIRRSNFTINYFHSKVTPEVRERASKEDKERIQRTLDILAKKTGSYINKSGCVITEKIKNEERKEQPHKRSIKIETKEEQPEPIQVKKFSSEAPEEKPAVQVIKNKDGLSISITLNINLNNER